MERTSDGFPLAIVEDDGDREDARRRLTLAVIVAHMAQGMTLHEVADYYDVEDTLIEEALSALAEALGEAKATCKRIVAHVG